MADSGGADGPPSDGDDGDDPANRRARCARLVLLAEILPDVLARAAMRRRS
jgi:hypothetical protein